MTDHWWETDLDTIYRNMTPPTDDDREWWSHRVDDYGFTWSDCCTSGRVMGYIEHVGMYQGKPVYRVNGWLIGD